MNEHEFRLDYFREQGFRRGKCTSCGAGFWSLGEEKVCGEPPCVDYTFLRNSPMKRSGGPSEIREFFLRFMERNGHKRISRYPIVARWRDDVFFVQASIYDFQPWVINGSVRPPANPLTMSQPCVRFNDIDNVGKTGRHFTLFEMMTHTAFNTEKEWHYFKDETVALCQEFFTKEMGVHEGLISYKEAEWEGGGNSGPCFEVLIRGAEVATLVFMMYTDQGGRKVKMPMQVVDTGYGLERIAWVSQGSPSAYEAVFGGLLQELKEEMGIHADEKLLSEYSRVAGLMDAKTPGAIGEIRKSVARNMGISLQELLHFMVPLEHLYAVLDHTRALAFMLHDGVMPSNVREGYFARLLIRRGMRALSSLSQNKSLAEIVSRQIDHWKKDFPELEEEREDIIRIVEFEEKKYFETVARGKSLVQKLQKSGGIDEQRLMELYESHGLTPEQVAELAPGVQVPDDFYARVASRHSGGALAEAASSIPLPELPPTERMYYTDQYMAEFDAKVLYCSEKHVVLDRTCFYPEGGGQDPDTGYIAGRRVSYVRLQGNVIIHEFEGRPLSVGQEVHCSVDRDRRMDLMRHHTATHILLSAARHALGNHVWQAGAHKQRDEGRLDITHYAPLSQAEIEKIERLANQVILENRRISVEVMERGDAEGRYGFRLYQGGVVPGREIRVVTIEGWDVEACAGTHCERTGEVGTVKIKETQRIQDGTVRLTFVAGLPALKLVQGYSSTLRQLRESLNTDMEHLLDAVRKKDEELEKLRNEMEQMERQSLQELSAKLLGEAVVKHGITFVVAEYSQSKQGRRALLRMLTSGEREVLAIVVGGGEIMVARNSERAPSCRAVLAEITGKFGGNGGGNDSFAQGTTPAGEAQIRALIHSGKSQNSLP